MIQPMFNHIYLKTAQSCCGVNVNTESEILEVADKTGGNEILLKQTCCSFQRK